jgi:hypothetical protein
MTQFNSLSAVMCTLHRACLSLYWYQSSDRSYKHSREPKMSAQKPEEGTYPIVRENSGMKTDM